MAGLLAAPAYADDAPSATPTVGIGDPAYVQGPTPTPTASDWPDHGGWIIGGTLQEGTVAGPKAGPKAAPAPVKHAAPAPVVRPVTVTAPVARTQTVTAPAAGVPTALPFTGPGRLATQLTLGAALVLIGGGMTIGARTKRTFAPLR